MRKVLVGLVSMLAAFALVVTGCSSAPVSRDAGAPESSKEKSSTADKIFKGLGITYQIYEFASSCQKNVSANQSCTANWQDYAVQILNGVKEIQTQLADIKQELTGDEIAYLKSLDQAKLDPIKDLVATSDNAANGWEKLASCLNSLTGKSGDASGAPCPYEATQKAVAEHAGEIFNLVSADPGPLGVSVDSQILNMGLWTSTGNKWASAGPADQGALGIVARQAYNSQGGIQYNGVANPTGNPNLGVTGSKIKILPQEFVSDLNDAQAALLTAEAAYVEGRLIALAAGVIQQGLLAEAQTPSTGSTPAPTIEKSLQQCQSAYNTMSPANPVIFDNPTYEQAVCQSTMIAVNSGDSLYLDVSGSTNAGKNASDLALPMQIQHWLYPLDQIAATQGDLAIATPNQMWWMLPGANGTADGAKFMALTNTNSTASRAQVKDATPLTWEQLESMSVALKGSNTNYSQVIKGNPKLGSTTPNTASLIWVTADNIGQGHISGQNQDNPNGLNYEWIYDWTPRSPEASIQCTFPAVLYDQAPFTSGSTTVDNTQPPMASSEWWAPTGSFTLQAAEDDKSGEAKNAKFNFAQTYETFNQDVVPNFGGGIYAVHGWGWGQWINCAGEPSNVNGTNGQPTGTVNNVKLVDSALLTGGATAAFDQASGSGSLNLNTWSVFDAATQATITKMVGEAANSQACKKDTQCSAAAIKAAAFPNFTPAQTIMIDSFTSVTSVAGSEAKKKRKNKN